MGSARRTATALVVAAVVVLGGCTPDQRTEPVPAPTRMAADFPLADGELLDSADLGSAGWSATVRVADAGEQQDALDALVARGFTIHGDDEDEQGERVLALSDGELSVTLALSRAPEGPLVSYSVAPVVLR